MLLSHWAHTLLINCLIIPHQSWSSKDIDKYLVDNSIPILCRAKPLLLIMINHDCLSAGRARCVNLKGGHPAFWDGTFQEFRSFRIQAAAVAAASASRSQQGNASPTPHSINRYSSAPLGCQQLPAKKFPCFQPFHFHVVPAGARAGENVFLH